MDLNQFWKIIDTACQSDPESSEEWDDELVIESAKLPANEIVEWNHLFDDLAAKAFQTDLWAAAYVINGRASDDGFYYFRTRLIIQREQRRPN